MILSVVIPTYNRVASLRDVLEGLRRQTLHTFEVIVVNGPSTDGTAAFLGSVRKAVRSVDNPLPNLSISRNLGIEAAAGDVVAFIDDDAVPEPRWLEDLAAAFGDERVVGAGGLVLDHTGVHVQWRHLVCSRVGEQDFDQLPPLDRFAAPGADPFLYLAGGNCAMRRTALADIGGFDEEIEYNFDEADVCLRLLDRGGLLRSLETAVIHHRFLPSHQRSARAVTDPFFEVKNRVYFALSHGNRGGDTSRALASANRHLGRLRATAREAERAGRLSPEELARYLGRADAGFHVGLRRGLDGRRLSRTFGPPDSSAFVPYPVLTPRPRRRVAVVGPAGARAATLAKAGHEVHELVPAAAEANHRIDYRMGAWVHTVPVGARRLPELGDSPLRVPLHEAAALMAAMASLRDREPADVEVLPREAAALPHLLLADLLRMGDGPAAAALATLLRERAALSSEQASRVALRLLERDRFPTDYEEALRPCLGLPDDGAFVDCAYAALLGRPPDPLGRRSTLAELAGGGDRIAIVERIATSAEGRARGIDPAFVARLPEVSLAQAQATLRSAWLEEDDEFVRRVHLALTGGESGAPADATHLVEGLSRHELVEELVMPFEVRERVAGTEELPPGDVRTREQLAGALNALARAPEPQFVDRLYRMLLGRPPDRAGAVAYTEALAAGRSRAWVVTTIAASDEAQRRGYPPEVVGEIVSRSRAYRRDAARRRFRSRLRRLNAGGRRAT